MNKIRFLLEDSLALSGRAVRHFTRRPDTMVTMVILPVIILLLFNYLFGGAASMSLPDGVNYLDYLLPGILLITIGYCATTTATGVCDDMTKGIIERFKSMPIARPAFIVGQTFGGLIRSIIAVSVSAALAFMIGFRSLAGFGGWLCVVGLLLFFALALTSLAVVLGLLSPSVDSAGSFGLALMFLPYFTGAFVPTYTMPTALRIFCENQPVNVVWEAVSGLLQGNTNISIWGAVLWCGGITLASFTLGGVVFARKTS